MSEENVEIVRQALALWDGFMRGELKGGDAVAEAGTRFVDPHIELIWDDERTMPDQPQRLSGVREIVGFWEQMRGAWVEMSLEPLETIAAADDRVVTPLCQTARGRESGVPIVFHSFLVWTIRRGRVHRMELFRHRADALEAAGLSE
jgi:hypothetical protein